MERPGPAGWALSPLVAPAVSQLLPHVDLEAITLKQMREKLVEHLGLEPDALEGYKNEVADLLTHALKSGGVPATFVETLPAELTSSCRAQKDSTDITQLTRQAVGDCVRDAFNNPVAAAAGRPVTSGNAVQKLAVFREAHEDGQPHFHIAVLLSTNRSWLPAKRTLRNRHHLPSHWSGSHRHFWSAVRYGAIATCKKPVVDQEPYQWSADGSAWSLFEAAQEPWNAHCWRQRGEQAERKRLCGEAKVKAKFSKLDLTAIIIEKDLKSPADIMTYTQNHGTHKMQEWVCANQRKLEEFLREAFEWQAVREESKLEKETEWALLCRMAETTCGQAGACGYAQAAQQFFAANAASLNSVELAFALRAVILSGPSKTTRAPIIVGPSNSGKTTVVLPFDELFGHNRVFHKPALNSSFPLVNLSKHKRFLFFDDFRPIEYAQETIDVGTFLSLFNGHPFEIRQSQAFRHGNEDFAWRKGCCLTAKDQELWEPWGNVSAEDVQHMKNRMHVFTCRAVLKDLRQTVPCASCMCKWISQGAAEADARTALQCLPPADAAPAAPSALVVEGLADLCARAKLPAPKVKALEAELVQLGAVTVEEVGISDWKGLASFSALLPFEQRRLLQAVCR
eukprot:s313_g36.t1